MRDKSLNPRTSIDNLQMGKMVQFLVLIISYIHFPTIIQNMAFGGWNVQVKATSRKKICLPVAHCTASCFLQNSCRSRKEKEAMCCLKKYACGPVESRKVFIY